MKLDFLTKEEQQAIQSGQLPDLGPEKLGLLKQAIAEEIKYTNQSSDRDKSVVEPIEETGDSPLSFIERLQSQFGDNRGRVDWLKKKGKDAVYRDGELYIKNKDGKLIPADPLTSDSDSALGNVLNIAKDIPSDAGEFVADLPAMVLQTFGELGGTVAGGYGGSYVGMPTVGAGAGKIAGSAAGSWLGEKIRELIGKKIGNYSGENEYQDQAISALIGGVAPMPGLAWDTGKTAVKNLARSGLKNKIAERLYASGAGLSQELIDNPETIDFLMENGLTGNADELIKMASELTKITENELKEKLAGKTISLDDIFNTLQKYKSRDVAGDIALKDQASALVKDEFRNKTDLFKETTKRIASDEIKDAEIPDDQYLMALYKKQFPKAEINLPMKVGAHVSQVPNKRPTFDEFKASILNQFSKENDQRGIEMVTKSKLTDGAEEYSDDFLRKMYEDQYPPTKSVTKVYPTPAGKMKPPSFDEWKNQYVGQLAKQTRPQASKTVTESTADAIDLNQAKRDLYKASQKLFNNETYQVTKKQAQKELSLAIKETLENAGGADIKELNKKLHAFSTLADMLDLKVSGELSKPVYKGTTRVMGSLGGAKSALLDLIQQTVLASTKANTKAGVGLKKTLETLANAAIEKPAKQPFKSFIQNKYNLLTSEAIRSLNRANE